MTGQITAISRLSFNGTIRQEGDGRGFPNSAGVLDFDARYRFAGQLAFVAARTSSKSTISLMCVRNQRSILVRL